MENETVPMPSVPQTVVTPPEVKKKNLLKYVIAAGVGVVVVVGIVVTIKMTAPAPVQPVPPVVYVPSPTPEVTQTELSLDVISPTDTTVVEGKLVKVTGTTLPDTQVAMFTENSDTMVQSNKDGYFEGSIEMTNGINNLVVTALADDGQEKTVTKEVVYDASVLGASTGQSKFKHEEEPVIGGMMEGITGGDMQLLDQKDKLAKNLKVNKTTLFVNENNKPINLTDLEKTSRRVIIMASGSSALKVFVHSATDSAMLLRSKKQAVQGIVSAINGQTITIFHQTQKNRTFSLMVNNKTVITIKGMTNATLAQIQIGQRLIAVGDNTGNGTITAKIIHVIPGKANGIENQLPATAAGTPSPTESASPSATSTP